MGAAFLLPLTSFEGRFVDETVCAVPGVGRLPRRAGAIGAGVVLSRREREMAAVAFTVCVGVGPLLEVGIGVWREEVRRDGMTETGSLAGAVDARRERDGRMPVEPSLVGRGDLGVCTEWDILRGVVSPDGGGGDNEGEQIDRIGEGVGG